MEKILSSKKYEKSIPGYSVTGNIVNILGEQTMQLEDGRIVEQYLYDIEGYVPRNGLPFVSLKANITVRA